MKHSVKTPAGKLIKEPNRAQLWKNQLKAAERGVTFQQDNKPWHTARDAMQRFRLKHIYMCEKGPVKAQT